MENKEEIIINGKNRKDYNRKYYLEHKPKWYNKKYYVYMFYTPQDIKNKKYINTNCLYVGSSKDLKRRINQHINGFNSCVLTNLIKNNITDVVIFATELKACFNDKQLRLIEYKTINKLKPAFNKKTNINYSNYNFTEAKEQENQYRYYGALFNFSKAIENYKQNKEFKNKKDIYKNKIHYTCIMLSD